MDFLKINLAKLLSINFWFLIHFNIWYSFRDKFYLFYFFLICLASILSIKSVMEVLRISREHLNCRYIYPDMSLKIWSLPVCIFWYCQHMNISHEHVCGIPCYLSPKWKKINVFTNISIRFLDKMSFLHPSLEGEYWCD